MTTRDDLLADKGSIIHEMFLHTADENYIVARWCFDNQLMTDFFWNSVHALEKYLKAVLLFNDKPVGHFSHGLVPLYKEAEALAGPLLPSVLARPATLDIFHWVDLAPLAFLEKLDQNGNAENRYLTYGFAQHAWYLHMVDAMVWAIRRLAIPLDMAFAGRRDVPDAASYRDILALQPNYAPGLTGTLDKVIRGEDSPKQRALLNNNCAFAPAGYAHEGRRAVNSGRNPIILRRILKPLESEHADDARYGYRMGTWLLDNTKQSKAVRDEIGAAMKAALARHPGIDKLAP